MNSNLTAIPRKSLPAPVKWLLMQGNVVQGHVLDFGCGKCKEINDRTIAQLPKVKSMTSYDPFYRPHDFIKKRNMFDTILCTYVLCVLPPSNAMSILIGIQSLLNFTGMVFITVRNDTPKWGHGVSSRGTFQRKVELPTLRTIREISQFRIFLLTKNSHLS